MSKINENLQKYDRISDINVKHSNVFLRGNYVSIQDRVNSSMEYEKEYMNKLLTEGWFKLENNEDIFQDIFKGKHFKYRLNGNSISMADSGTFRSGGIIIGKNKENPLYIMYKAYNGCLFPLQIKDISEVYVKDPNVEKTKPLIKKTVYFKRPYKISNYVVYLKSKISGEDVPVYYAKDNHTKERFMLSKKFDYAYKTGDWGFL